MSENAYGPMPVTRQVRQNIGGADQHMSERVRATSDDGKVRRLALIVVEKTETTRAATRVRGAPGRRNVIRLEEELQRTREQLRSASAAHDRAVAVLHTVNLELLSTNERQKAAAEVMRAGHEDVRSTNEDLTSINREHQSTIDELKRTNADLQHLIESTEIGTIILDSAMRIRRFTPAVAAVFNFVAADGGGPLALITHRLDYAALVEDVRRVLGSMERIEREVRSDTGESFIVRINPFLSVDGQIDGAVLTFFNHTAQHRVEEELRDAKTVAESANLAKGTFLSTLSHDFRSPLSAIMIFADTLQLGTTLTADQEQRVEGIKAGGRHLASMIDEIVRFTGLDAGHDVTDHKVLDARALAGEVHSLMGSASDAKDLVFRLDLPEEVVELETDIGKARRILINLCGNAVKYTRAGEIRLRVLAERERVIFEVCDTGIGIAAEDQRRIFDRFWQVDGCSTRSAGGMGIGLTAAREYSRLLGGDIEVESELGKGSTFRLWLPRMCEHR
jgi:two-component system, chemotaxis family, CheB/CheR fusion protein